MATASSQLSVCATPPTQARPPKPAPQHWNPHAPSQLAQTVQQLHPANLYPRLFSSLVSGCKLLPTLQPHATLSLPAAFTPKPTHPDSTSHPLLPRNLTPYIPTQPPVPCPAKRVWCWARQQLTPKGVGHTLWDLQLGLWTSHRCKLAGWCCRPALPRRQPPRTYVPHKMMSS